MVKNLGVGCISFLFYIKPQRQQTIYVTWGVVYLSFSTSNHNLDEMYENKLLVVYLSFSTSNHNLY